MLLICSAVFRTNSELNTVPHPSLLHYTYTDTFSFYNRLVLTRSLDIYSYSERALISVGVKVNTHLDNTGFKAREFTAHETPAYHRDFATVPKKCYAT